MFFVVADVSVELIVDVPQLNVMFVGVVPNPITVPVPETVIVPLPKVILRVVDPDIVSVVQLKFPVREVVPADIVALADPLKLPRLNVPDEDMVNPVPPDMLCPVASRLPVVLTEMLPVNDIGPVVVTVPALTVMVDDDIPIVPIFAVPPECV